VKSDPSASPEEDEPEEFPLDEEGA
jgi:hypothetical protein